MCGRKSDTGRLQPDRICVLLDGWPLAAHRESPASVHLWELLKAGEQAGVEMRLALPAFIDSLPAEAVVYPVKRTGWGRLMWEQKALPALARQTGAHILHSVSSSLPLSSPVPCVVSPAVWADSTGAGVMANLQASLGRGGYSRVRALLWPEDLPAPAETVPVFYLPPHVHPAFFTEEAPLPVQLPESYIFCPGPLNADTLDFLSEAWGWVSTGLGEDWVLAVDGISPAGAADIRERSGSTAQVLDAHSNSPAERAAWLRNASVVLLVGDSTAWGDPLLQALACRRPIAAEETSWNALRAGPAAYLTTPGDARMLGAAALTLAVEESVAEGLAEAAQNRWKELRSGNFPERLISVYREIMG